MWFTGKKRIYLDYASSTLPLKETVAAMREAEELIGNPGAIHAEGVAAKAALEVAREKVARELACKSREVIFTSGLTEAINLAVLGCARKLAMKGMFEGTHWIVSAIEHSAVLESFAEIERLGGKVTHINPDDRGMFSPETVLRAIRKETVLISIGWANNEIGVVQPIRDISRAVRAANDGFTKSVIFHSDAGQAPLYLSPQVHTLGVGLMSFGSNKLYGPHGVGALYVGTNVEIAPIVIGGGQERGLRSGTENVALAAGFAEAFLRIARERESEAKRVRTLRDAFAKEIEEKIPDVVFNTDIKRSLPHMLNISIPRIQSEYVTLALDQKGIAISTKSACAEGGARATHVVAALGGGEWPTSSEGEASLTGRAENTLRFSLGRDTTQNELSKTVRILAEIVKRGA